MITLYDATLRLPDGSPWLEYPVEIECYLHIDNGEYCVSVQDVRSDVSRVREPSRYISMLGPSADPLMAQVGHEILKQAEDDSDLLDRLIEDEGIYRPVRRLELVHGAAL